MSSRNRSTKKKKKKKRKKNRSASPSKNNVNNNDNNEIPVLENPGTVNLRVKQVKNKEPRDRSVLEAILKAGPDNADPQYKG